MSYEANYNTALTYLNAGLTDRAFELLDKAAKEVPDGEKTRDNAVYLKILSLLAKINLEKGMKDAATLYIEEGLKVKTDHSDLLFLKALYLWDTNRYDEMFGAIVTYLVSLVTLERDKYDYEFTGEGALKEVFETLIPVAYKKSQTRGETITIVKQLAEKTQNALLQRAYDVMLEMDRKTPAQQ
jgi:tetratricopeptide (TPR) repeat protein